MAIKQSVSYVKVTRTIKNEGRKSGEPRKEEKNSSVTVAPYVRVVGGKAVQVAGYSYTRSKA